MIPSLATRFSQALAIIRGDLVLPNEPIPQLEADMATITDIKAQITQLQSDVAAAAAQHTADAAALSAAQSGEAAAQAADATDKAQVASLTQANADALNQISALLAPVVTAANALQPPAASTSTTTTTTV